jgi:hypothetical protein
MRLEENVSSIRSYELAPVARKRALPWWLDSGGGLGVFMFVCWGGHRYADAWRTTRSELIGDEVGLSRHRPLKHKA